MKLKVYILLFLASAIFVSCQKEITDGSVNPSVPPASSGDLLVRAVQKEGSDSVVVVFTYDASKRLINENITGISQGVDVTNNTRLVRNASGIITQIVQKSPAFQPFGIDSVVTQVFYSNSRYTHSIQQFSLLGIISKDSTVLQYDAAGKVTRQDSYQQLVGITSYELSLRVEFTYDANGNVLQFKDYSFNPGSSTGVLAGITTYTYDNKVSPIRLSTPGEAFIISRSDMSAVNNPITARIEDATNQANTVNFTYAITYNAKNKPATAIITQNPGNIVSNATFTYQ
ncbi:MAG: hypothetical protein SFU87_15385 [Chitinophagaceae bacterium]|nr:hypothetical protein [Chitinophagaceae bacterium]